jgi:hypothetical protein
VNDDFIAANLQEQYLSGNKRMLSALYCEVRRIAEDMLPKMAAGVHRELEGEELVTMAHDAASRLVARYLRPEGYRVQFFCKTTWRECQYQLFDGGHQDRPGKKVEREMMPLEAAEDMKSGNGNGHEDTAYSFQDIVSDHPRGPDIIMDSYRSKSSREAIETIAQYISKRWLLDHAVRLKYVYKNTRRRHASNRSKTE